MLDYFKCLDGYKRKLKYIIYLTSMFIPLLLLYAVSEIGETAGSIADYIIVRMNKRVIR